MRSNAPRSMSGQSQALRQDSAPMYCPKNAPYTDQRSTIPGHVFALTREEAEASLKLIQGMISLNNQQISTLFDSGATYSFIFDECAQRLELHIVEMPFVMNVSTSVGASVRTSRAWLKVELKFGEIVTSIDLIYLPISRIDVIIGMDWLSANRATLDYNRKTVSLPMYTVTTMNNGTTPSVEKSVKKGCQTFMVFFSMHGVYDRVIDNIGVVNKFPKVFADKVSRLLPERGIEFSIDLVLGAKPISKALYQMDPIELNELKK
ncbi:uncharacterized protein LOC129316455 [Prosopis cineraria]|uniref:uncharacterized protein LOC129316455 n=1 Tax=Prosopis cineraria TaxID=364024 RepID=UPI00240ED8D9|nr:uncharacterized protein LOC129316455 [Prosopis cineraria]